MGIEEIMESAEISYSVDAVDKKAKNTDVEACDKVPSCEDVLKEYTKDKIKEKIGSSSDELSSEIGVLLSAVGINIKANCPVDALVYATKAMKLFKELSDSLVPFCNAEYKNGVTEVAGGTLKKYTPKRVWKYSEEVEELEIKVKTKKAAEVKSGKAKDVSKPVDVTKSKLFSISLKK